MSRPRTEEVQQPYARLVALLERIRAVLTADGVGRWLYESNRALEGRSPHAALADGDLERVEALVDQLAEGAHV